MTTIGSFVTSRLAAIFEGGVAEPGVLRNRTGSPMYLLFFAAANPKARGPALRIANAVLKELR